MSTNEAIAELACRIDELVAWAHTGQHHRLALARRIQELEKRIDTLQIEQPGNDRTFREVISDIAELTQYFEGLGEWARKRTDLLMEGSMLAADHHNALVERVRQLEKLLEREE